MCWSMIRSLIGGELRVRKEFGKKKKKLVICRNFDEMLKFALRKCGDVYSVRMKIWSCTSVFGRRRHRHSHTTIDASDTVVP